MTERANQCCANCNAFLPDAVIAAEEGACRDSPPVPIYNGQKKDNISFLFPRMRREGWCRRWQPVNPN